MATGPTLPDPFRRRLSGGASGITSVCTAHPLAIEAAFLHGRETGARVLIEATCNQVNPEGGYTGMTPRMFRTFVEEIADRARFPLESIILGGDHLGPNPWKHLESGEAMARAKTMIAAYAEAGFRKLHLDCSMGCAGEPLALSDEVVAKRAAEMAGVAEGAVVDGEKPIYVIGTEVPIPGGALEEEEGLAVTSPEAALRTIEVHRQAFEARGLDDAFGRAVAAVVQPGVEFGNASVIRYEPSGAAALSGALACMPQFVFEAHSTDYQSGEALGALVRDGFAILKVGPELTFALREALYGLDAIAAVLVPDDGPSLPAVMETIMTENPEHWTKYYHGDDAALRIQRHYSYSDRIRYYWPRPDAQGAVDRLFVRLGERPIPAPLVGQFLGKLYPAATDGSIVPTARQLALASVRHVLERYAAACASR